MDKFSTKRNQYEKKLIYQIHYQKTYDIFINIFNVLTSIFFYLSCVHYVSQIKGEGIFFLKYLFTIVIII